MIKPLLVITTCGILCQEIKSGDCARHIIGENYYLILAAGEKYATGIDIAKIKPNLEVLWKDNLEPVDDKKCSK